jgi:hypothetical protein
VLHAYSQYDRDVAYCQGMAFVAGVSLMVNDDEVGEEAEENAFWTFAAMVKTKGLDGFYRPGMPGIVAECDVFGLLVSEMMPEVAARLAECGVMSLLFVVPWMIPLFSNLAEGCWATVMRIYDMFMADGIPALRRIALAIISSYREELMAMGPDATKLIPFLINPPSKKLKVDQLIAEALRIPLDDLAEKIALKAKECAEARAAGPKTPVAMARTPTQRKKRMREGDGDREEVVGQKRRAKEEDDNEDEGGLAKWIRKTLTPGSASPARIKAKARAKKQAPMTAGRIGSPVVLRRTPTKTATATTTTTPKVSPGGGPALSPESRSVLREFATPTREQCTYAGRQWRITPKSPISPVMMELCPVPLPRPPNDDDGDDPTHCEFPGEVYLDRSARK